MGYHTKLDYSLNTLKRQTAKEKKRLEKNNAAFKRPMFSKGIQQQEIPKETRGRA